MVVRRSARFACTGGKPPADPAPTPKPASGHVNFLFVYLDDQRFDAMQFVQKLQGDKARFPWLQTPNMDKLASEGVWFRNAFATDSPLFAQPGQLPHRQYPHTHGVVNNHMPLPAEHGNLRHAAPRGRLLHRLYRQMAHGRSAGPPRFDFAASFLGRVSTITARS